VEEREAGSCNPAYLVAVNRKSRKIFSYVPRYGLADMAQDTLSYQQKD
tara:strand:- start:10673 stop:10816 length:144 start_codon:yes stop_codon:yes gene_type:complete